MVAVAGLLNRTLGDREPPLGCVWPGKSVGCLKRPAPILGAQFHLPSSQKLDLPLIGGSALFGVGWGIAGFCPGGALPAIGTGKAEVLIFVAALLAGIFLAKVFLVPLVARLAASA